MREVPEWIGRTPDTPIPERVKIRIFERCGGRCHRTGRKLMPGDDIDYDHIIAICNGGQNRESNLAPILRGKVHREKTAEDVQIKAKIARVKAKHLGLAPKTRTPLRSRGFAKSRLWPASGNDDSHDNTD